MNESVSFPALNTPVNFPSVRVDAARPGAADNTTDTGVSRVSRQLRAWLRRTAVGLGTVQLLLDAGRSGEAGEALATVRGDFQLLRYALDGEAEEASAPGRSPNLPRSRTAGHGRRGDVRKN